MAEADSNITVRNCSFQNNSAAIGGVFYSTYFTTLSMQECNFECNYATVIGGVLVATISTVPIESCLFRGNHANLRGGVLEVTLYVNLTIQSCSFLDNYAPVGAGIEASSPGVTLTVTNSNFTSNVASRYAIMDLSRCNALFSGTNSFSMNSGSILIFNSQVTFKGMIDFSDNQGLQAANVVEGGALTIIQSNVTFDGQCILYNNSARSGGAVRSSESKLYVISNISISNNMATLDGGGLHLTNSELNCLERSRLNLFNNSARRSGGGIHAISSYLRAHLDYDFVHTVMYFTMNTAEKGGGLSLEANAKLYVLSYSFFAYDIESIEFSSNTADYGGAVYVDDATNTGACSSSQETECFYQVLIARSFDSSIEGNDRINFTQNTAESSGGTLYGGMLDRCSVSPFAESLNKEHGYLERGTGLNYFMDHTVITNVSISSAAMKVCPCIHGNYNCTQQHNFSQIEVKKGQVFSLSVVAVDQAGQPVSSVIRASLDNTESGLAEGQLERSIPDICTRLAFSLTSPHEAEILSLHAADGPCKDADLSTMTVQIKFLPCTCPIGFQPFGSNATTCTCTCHEDIAQYVQCDISSESLTKDYQSVTWISYDNASSSSGYLVYINCPYDYCKSSQLSVTINLNELSGADAQCAFNRSSLLCGSCQTGLSLSLGSSLCLSCPSYWPVLLVFVTIAALIAGVALIAILLLLNMTVAVGSMNGLIFYANIVAAYTSVLLPFSKPTYATVFISWLNLELGIDTCFFKGMDAYSKTWIELIFPTYIITIIIIVIVISSYSSRFSKAISNKHPVATLTTLLLLSYAKLLALVFKILAFGTLEYPDGSRQVVWLPDATVKYLAGKHIALFAVALVILLLGLFFTILVFSWQSLLHLPEWKIFNWSRNPRLQTFIETYHIPFNAKHRYWPGLLLLVRAILYLVAAVNVSNDPKVALTSIIFCVGFLLVLKGAVGNIYKKCFLDILEVVFYFNTLFLCLFTWYSLGAESNEAVAAYISVSISMALLLLIIVYHIYTYTNLLAKLHKTKFGLWLDAILGAEYIIPKPKPDDLRQADPHNLDDVHRFDELMAAIDRPVNTNDYCLSPRTIKAPSQSVVELPKREANLSNPYRAETTAMEEKLGESISKSSHVPAEC